MIKRLFSAILILVMLISTTAPMTVNAAENRGILVLVQTEEDGKFVAYRDISSWHSYGGALIDAKEICRILGFKYTESETKFCLIKGKQKLVFTDDYYTYKYNNGTKTVNKTALAPVSGGYYISRYCYYGALENFGVSTKYFTKSQAAMNDLYGYRGVICYSTVGKITSFPNINDIIDEEGNAINNNSEEKIDDPILKGYSGTININGVEIPKLKKFAKIRDYYWGCDIKGNTPLEDAIELFSLEMRKDIMELNDADNPGEFARVTVLDDSMVGQFEGDFTMSPLRLRKQTDEKGNRYYEIYLSVRLRKNPKPTRINPDYSQVLNDTLKLFTACISSTPEKLYETIYVACEEDSSVLSETKWTTVGDCKVKYRVENRHAIIFSIKAK